MMSVLDQWWWSGQYLWMNEYYVIFSHDSMEGLVGRVDKADRLPDDDVARHCAQDWSWRRHFQEKILGIGRSLFPQKLTVESRKILRWPKNSLRVLCADEEMGSLDLLTSNFLAVVLCLLPSLVSVLLAGPAGRAGPTLVDFRWNQQQLQAASDNLQQLQSQTHLHQNDLRPLVG